MLKNGWTISELRQMNVNIMKKIEDLKSNINGINNDMMTEIIRELTKVKKISEITSKQVLIWVRGVKVQKAQKSIHESAKYNNEDDAVKRHEQKNDTSYRAKLNRRETLISCKYCGNSCEQRKCPAYNKRCL